MYESALLSLPMIFNCDEIPQKNKPCNQEMLLKLNDLHQGSEKETDPRWNELYKLIINNVITIIVIDFLIYFIHGNLKTKTYWNYLCAAC